MVRCTRWVPAMRSCRPQVSGGTGKCSRRRASTTRSMSDRTGRIVLWLGLLCGLGACREGPVVAASGPAEPAATGCLANGEGQLEASLRGALEADLAWTNEQMQCDGE